LSQKIKVNWLAVSTYSIVVILGLLLMVGI